MSETETHPAEELTRLREVDRLLRQYFTSNSFPDMVLARLGLERIYAVRPVNVLDADETQWRKHKAEVDAVFATPRDPAALPTRVRVRARA